MSEINYEAMVSRHEKAGIVLSTLSPSQKILDLSPPSYSPDGASMLSHQLSSQISHAAQRSLDHYSSPMRRLVLRIFVRPMAHFSHLVVATVMASVVVASIFGGGNFEGATVHAATGDAPVQTLAMLANSSDLNVPITPNHGAQSATDAQLGYIDGSNSPVTAHKAIKAATSYVVQSGDTPSTIAAKFNISTNTLLWANNLSDGDNIKPGQTLTVPPVTGVLYQIAGGDTVAGIAAAFKTSSDKILAANDIDPDAGLTAGRTLIVPDGVKVAKAAPAASTSSSATSTRSLPSFVGSSGGSNSFPYGYCTWWVAHQRSVTWSGNAWQWYGNAQAAGRSVGRTPIPGSIMVTWESSVGHVAYVESVNGGSFTVSEMNYAGWGVVSHRTISVGSVPLIGFIY